MAKYLDRLNGLLEEGVLTQEQYDELADLSAAKEAIKGFNQIRSERDELQNKLQRYETQPKRKAALEPFGIDYDKAPKYLKSVFDSMDPDKLEDQDYVSQHLRDNDVEVTAPQAGGDQEATQSGAAQIVTQGLNAGRAASQQETYESAIAAAQTQQDLDAVYQRFGKQPANT